MSADVPTRPRPMWRRLVGALGQVLLTAAAGVGLLCILAVPLALWFGIGFTMFSTGSMAPTIPAGSVAVVREIPASDVAVGDVVTVERPGELPVTHRVRTVADGPGESRTLVLRGDANASDDAEPYQVSTVGLVLFSVPGIAPVVAGLGNPLVLGGLTIGAAGLVLWAFWPRRAAGAAVAVLAVAVALTQLPAATPPAAAEVRERVVAGPVITLVAVGDEQAMTALTPGAPVHWQVGVLSDPPEPGTLQVSIRATGKLSTRPDGLQLQVASCPQRWQDGRCPVPADELITAGPAQAVSGRDHRMAEIPAGEPQWLLVTAWLPGDWPPTDRPATGTAAVRITAAGFGDSVSTEPDEPMLPGTGADRSSTVALVVGSVALAAGIVLLTAARRQRTAPGRRGRR